MRAPALPLAVGFLAGTALPATASVAAVAIVVAAGFALSFRGRLSFRTTLIAVGFVALGAAARGGGLGERRDGSFAARYEELGAASFLTPRLVAGRLRREPVPGPAGWILTLDAESVVVSGVEHGVRGGVRIRVRGAYGPEASLGQLAAGDRVLVWARLSPPSFFRNPGSASDGARRYFEREGIHLVGSVKSPLLVERVAEAAWWSSFPSRARRAARARLEARLGHDPEVLGVLLALVSGERALVDDALEERYRRAGFYHVMAISGAHVGVVLLVLHGVGKLAGVETRTSLFAMLVALPLYAAFCGGRAPVARAALMAAIFAGARLLGLPGSRWNALAVALLLFLVWDPASALDPGLHMSFAGMTAIFGLCELPRSPARHRGGRAWRHLRWVFSISLAASAGVVPVAAWHFQRVSCLSPVTSLVAMPLASISLVLGLAAVAASSLPWLGGALALMAVPPVTALNALARFASELPAASFVVPRPGAPWVAAYVLALATWRLAAGRLLPRAAAVALVTACGTAWFLPGKPELGRLRMTALDVGHGDALVLSLPDGRLALVDGGGLPGSSFDVGARIIVPHLVERRRRGVDVVIATHRDHDHVGGLPAVVESLRVGAIWEGRSDADRAGYGALRRVARRRRVPVRTLEAGERFAFGGVVWEVLAAGGRVGPSSSPSPLLEAGSKENERSLVLRITYGRSRLLLTGDAEAGLEGLLVRSGASLGADVLKVAHHGSATSSTEAFLDAVGPRLAIVSARAVPFRPIPAERVLRRLRERGVRVLRTDRDGAVDVTLYENGAIETSTFAETVARP